MKVFILSTLLLSLSIASAQIPDGYKVVTVPLPRGAVSVLGLCHKPDGTLAIATWEGEVWERKDGSVDQVCRGFNGTKWNPLGRPGQGLLCWAKTGTHPPGRYQ